MAGLLATEKLRELRRKIGGLCCYPGCWERGFSPHLALTLDKKGKPVEEPEPGLHLFLLCPGHYTDQWGFGARHLLNWDEDRQANTDEYYLLLRAGWLEKRARVKGSDGPLEKQAEILAQLNQMQADRKQRMEEAAHQQRLKQRRQERRERTAATRERNSRARQDAELEAWMVANPEALRVIN